MPSTTNNPKPTIKLQPPPVEVSADNPFDKDLMGRKDFGEALAASLAAMEGACVIAVNGRWGTGKTTFVNMFTQHLRNKKFTVVGINAWETDYADAPLAALSCAVEREIEEEGRSDFNAAAKRLLRAVAPPLIRLATQGLLDLDASIEQAASDGVARWADASLQRFEEHQKSLGDFRQTLERVAKDCGDRPLVVVVDELDRCRPTYAVEFLETIKHVFDVDGVVFVLAINRDQLDQSAAVLYGTAADPESYFRRFFDFELALPDPDRRELVRALLGRFGVRGDDNAGILVTFLAASPYGIRSLQQTVGHYAIVRSALQQYDERGWWWILPTLIILRLADETGYRALKMGTRTGEEIADAFLGSGWAKSLRGNRDADFLEAAIIVASSAFGGNRGESPLLKRHEEARNGGVARWIQELSNGYRSTRMVGIVSDKIEILDIRG